MYLMICYNNYAIAEIPSEFQVASAIRTTGKLPPNTQTRHINYCNASNLEAGQKTSQKACCQQHPPVLLNQHPGQSKHDAHAVAGCQ